MDYSLQLRELTLWEIPIRILLSVVLSGVIGLEREFKNRAAGFRTYMLVCMGSCIVMMTNQYVYQFLATGDPVRMGAQVISGIGFLGAGTIIVTKRSQIKGLTTAAGLWTSACMGLAIGVGFYEVSIISTACVLIVLTLFHSWEEKMRRNSKIAMVYVELRTGHTIKTFLTETRKHDLSVSNFQMEVPNGDMIAFVANLKRGNTRKKETIVQELRELNTVAYLEEL